MSEREPTREEVLGEPAKLSFSGAPLFQKGIDPLRDPVLREKAVATRNANMAEKRRKADKSRAELNLHFLADLNELWREHGKAILSRAAFAHPEKVAKLIADLVPKQLEVKTSAVQDLDDDRLDDLVSALSERLGRGATTALNSAQGRAGAQTIEAEIIDVPPVQEAT
jgi:hypothetical protein